MATRLLPLAAIVVPLGWWLAGRPPPYPYALDILLVSPFLVDVVGNALDLYHTIDSGGTTPTRSAT